MESVDVSTAEAAILAARFPAAGVPSAAAPSTELGFKIPPAPFLKGGEAGQAVLEVSLFRIL